MPKTNRPKLIVCLALALASCCTNNPGAHRDDIVVTHLAAFYDASGPNIIVVFTYDASVLREQELYEDAAWAVDVTTVLADGGVIAPENTPITRRPDLPPVLFLTTRPTRVCYSYASGLIVPDGPEHWNIVFFNEPPESNCKVFRVPRATSEIVMTYRIRFPNGTFSDNHQVTLLALSR